MTNEQLAELRKKALETGSQNWDQGWMIVALLAEITIELRGIRALLPLAGRGN
jgi:hypothetical protein